ncbi:MAG: Smr/MutS family protein [Novosphingobium sp.]
MKPPRGLTPEEAELWKRVAATVTPIRRANPPRARLGEGGQPQDGAGAMAQAQPSAKPPRPRNPSTTRSAGGPPPRDKLGEDLKKQPRPIATRTLDGTWDRKLSGGTIQPDFTLDLHGHTLDSAHARLDHGLTQALAQGARVLLLITGKARPGDDHAGRGSRRGAIRAKVLDWLALGSHASRIAAVRNAHPRHGGAGALYIVLKRAR